jgi:hypothetical protein
MESKVVNLSDIHISYAFWKTPPKPEKINTCYAYYREHGKFDRDIVIDEKGTLRDGYVAYLVARMMNITSVWVKIVSRCAA